jgi:hypothetical protein
LEVNFLTFKNFLKSHNIAYTGIKNVHRRYLMPSYKLSKNKTPSRSTRSGKLVFLKYFAVFVVCSMALSMLIYSLQNNNKPITSAATSYTPAHGVVNKPPTTWSGSPFGQGKPEYVVAAPIQSPTASPQIPRGVTAEELQTLKDRLDNHPRRDQEMKRILDFMAYRHDLEQLKQLAESGNSRSAQAMELAKDINAGLPARLQQREIMGSDAMMIKAMVLDVIDPDPTRRKASLKDFESNITAAMAIPADPRDADFLAQQDKLLAAFHAVPEAARNLDQYRADLHALRMRIYASNQPAR